MSTQGDGDLDLFAAIIYEVDPVAAGRAARKIAENQDAILKGVKKFNEAFNAMGKKAQTEHLRTISFVNKERERLAKQADRRDEARLERLAQRQRDAGKQQLETQKATNKAAHQAQVAADRQAAQLRDHRLKEERRAERTADFKMLADQKQAHKLSLQAQKAADVASGEARRQANKIAMEAERRQTQAERIEAQRRRDQEQAQMDRRLARTRAFWSVTRSVGEAAGRGLIADTRSLFSRLFASQQDYERRSLFSWRSHNTQVAAANRSAIAAQGGVIATAQARSQRGTLGAVGNLYGLAAGFGGYLSARMIFGPVADYQQTQIAFESLLGSAERAEGFLARMREFAERTPFEFAGVAEGARRLLAVGFAARDVIPALTDIGNVAATLGVGEAEINGVIRALGQMQGKGKASAEELQQISEQLPGFSAVQAIAESLGLTVAETFDQMRDGAISGSVGVQAILEGMRDFDGAAGAMDRQAETINGRLSTLKDTITNLIIDALSPFADEMADAIGYVTTMAESLFRGNGAWAVARSAILGVAAAVGVLVAIRVADWVRLAVVSINPLTAGFFALAAGLAILIRHVPQVQEAFSRAAEIISSSWDDIGGAIGALMSGDVDGFVATFKSLGSELWAVLEPAFTFVASRARDLWDRVFGSVSDWISGGGIGRVANAVTSALSSVVGVVADFLSDNLVPIAAAGITALALSTIGLLPTLLIAAAGGAVYVWREKILDALKMLPFLLMVGLYRLGKFLGGPVVSAIFSETGVKIMGAIIAGAVGAVGSFAWGLVDGLRQSIPAAFSSLNDVVQDALSALFGGFYDIPIISMILVGLEVPLRGITSAIEVFANILGAIPTPIYAGAAALWVMTRAFTALRTSVQNGRIGMAMLWVQDIVPRLQAASAQLNMFAAKMALVSKLNDTIGGKTIFGSLALGARGAAVAASGLATALPGIGAAAMIGLPIVMGLMESARARTARFNQEVKQIGDSFTQGKDIETFLRNAISESDGLAQALNEVGLEVDDLIGAVSTGATADIGEMFAGLSPELAEQARDIGMSLSELGAAAAEGDNGLRDMALGMGASNHEASRLKATYQELPESLRQVVDTANEGAQAFVEQQLAAGNLTDEQVRLYTAIEDGSNTSASYIQIAEQVTSAQQRQADQMERTRGRVGELIDKLGEATDDTESFRDAIDRLTGSAIEVGRANQNIESIFDTIAQGIRDGEGINEMGDELLSAADGIIGVYQTLSDAGRPREAAREYERLRDRLRQQYRQLGLNRDQARNFTDALVPPVDEIAAELDRAQSLIIDQLRSQRRNLQRALTEGRLGADARAAAEEMLANIDAEIASYDPSVIQVAARINYEEVRWDQTVAQYERMFERGQIDVGINLTPPGGGGGDGGLGHGFAGPGKGTGGVVSAEGGGGFGLAQALKDWRQWAESVAIIMASVTDATTEAARKMYLAMDGTQRDIERRFRRFGVGMTSAAKSIGFNIVGALTSALKAGTAEVGQIVRGYGNTIVNSLNPILRSVGKDPIQLSFARGGIAGPNIASASDGPIVHVYNEGRGGTGSRYGEAYIPFDPTMKSRSRSIAARTVQRLGGHVQWFANGGITTPVPNVAGNWQGLHPEFARRLSMWATSLGQTYTVGSGYRSFAEQARLYQAYLAGVPGQAPAAPPGSSLHNFGLASDGDHWSGRNEGAFRLDYPMSYEPWHVQVAEGKGFLRDGFVPFNPIERPPDAGRRGVLSAVARAVMDYLYRAALSYAGGLSGGGSVSLGSVSAPPEVMAGIRRAMSIVGVPSSWLGPLLTLIERESGFSPTAYNSVLGASGLMQTIPSTFAAYALPGLGGIFDIVANVVAGLRYILDRYGSIFNVGQATAAAPTSGYYSGGIITTDGLYRAGEFGRREMVLPIDNPRRTVQLLSQTGVLDALSDYMDLGGSATSRSRTAPATNDRSAPIVGTVEVHSNATDPEAVGMIAAARVGAITRRVRMAR